MTGHVHTIPIRPEHTTEPWRTWDELVNVGALVPPPPEDCEWQNIICGPECPYPNRTGATP